MTVINRQLENETRLKMTEWDGENRLDAHHCRYRYA